MYLIQEARAPANVCTSNDYKNMWLLDDNVDHYIFMCFSTMKTK